jgi:ATP-dependent RNA helicase DDX10/DBP4
MNILVATPGRLLQHMDETPYFDCSSLCVLVLDEADRVLDMARSRSFGRCYCVTRHMTLRVRLLSTRAQGFSAAVNAIVENLPRSRQTLLFSATQTRRVADLARLSLRDPEYVAVHEHAASATPPRLTQLAATVALPDKMHALWGFVKTHLTSKTIVFLSSCRQVAFAHEALRQLRPGVPLRALHGRMKQPRRMAAFYDFCSAPAMVLLATDIAARGLDFPAVDWVLQVDAPEDVAMYIHRVGRTARYTAAGRSLLLLAPSEAALLPQLAAAKIIVTPTPLNLNRTPTVTPALAGLLSQDPLLKAQAQKAVVSYLKSVHLQPNKAVFDVTALPVAAYAASLGLTNPPKLRFVTRVRGGRGAVQEEEEAAAAAGGTASDSDEDRDGDADDEDGDAGRRQAGKAAAAEEEEDDEAGEQEAYDAQDDELLCVKRRNHALPGEAEPEPLPLPSGDGIVPAPARAKKAPRLKIRAGGVAGGARGTKVVFDADGTPRLPLEALARSQAEEEAQQELARCVIAVANPACVLRHRMKLNTSFHSAPCSGEAEDYRAAVAARYAATSAARAEADVADKRRERELRREKKRLRKSKLRARAERGDGGAGVELGAPGDDDDDDDVEDDDRYGDGSGSGSGSDEEEAAPKKRKREAAHAGMGKRGPAQLAGASIAELEAAALARLAGRV